MLGNANEPDTETLLGQIANGNDDARQQLLQRFQKRLRQMFAVRIDDRLAARIDASDVVQETLLEAALELPRYLAERPLPFYPWLRQIGWRRLSRLYEYHVTAQRRSVSRENLQELPLSEHSLGPLANRLLSCGPSPSDVVASREQRQQVRMALAQLSENDREVLVLRFLEHLSLEEIAAILGIREGAVRVRQLRALQRLRKVLGDLGDGRP
jgi:RNA polymerase sigma-70 factor, ECF subfamily